MPELDSEAVSFRVASESFAAVHQLEKRDMEILRLAIRYQGRKVPTLRWGAFSSPGARGGFFSWLVADSRPCATGLPSL